MNVAQAAILGVVQGITEFFPISSSGHLVILQSLFGFKEPMIAFDIFLHLGTLSSVLIFFRRDIAALFTRERKMIAPLFIASIPAFVVGFFFKDRIEQCFAMPEFTGWMMLITGLWLTIAATHARKVDLRGLADRQVKLPGPVSALLIGIAQAAAILPGISRSGSTISTGILTGVEKEAACRFSFLLSIPAIAGASLVKMREIGSGLSAAQALPFLVGAIIAMLTGVFAIRFLLTIIKNNRLYLFGIYCFLAGLLIIIVL